MPFALRRKVRVIIKAWNTILLGATNMIHRLWSILRKRHFSYIACLLMIAAQMLCCSYAFASLDRPDYWPTDGWRSASPESQGMDSDLLLDLLDAIWSHKLGINGLLIIRNGYIVLEANGYAYDATDKRNIYSCSKSVSSALIGIALDQGHVESVHQPILEFFPKKIPQKQRDLKHDITLQHLLTMSTGLKCRDSYLYQWRGLHQMEARSDWVQFFLDLPLVEEPGTRFEYCNANSFLLSAIVQQQTHMNTLEFAKQNLFEPLGITDVSWPSNPQGITLGYSQLHLQPRDMAKIGYLYLHQGNWDKKQLISSQWIRESTRKHVAATWIADYGYQWWVIKPGVFTALGHDGQYIIVVPEKNIVVVFTSSLIAKDTWGPMGLLFAYILPAAKSPPPLSQNSDVCKTLESVLNAYNTTRERDPANFPSEHRRPKSETALATYRNQTYGFSIQYDAGFKTWNDQHPSPLIFRVRDLRSLPELSVLVDDIPSNLDLAETAVYLMDYYKKVVAKPKVKIKSKYLSKLPNPIQKAIDYVVDTYKALLRQPRPKIKQEAVIELSGGTAANHIIVDWQSHNFQITTTAVIVYHKQKLICALAHGFADTPLYYLNNMVTSLTLHPSQVN